MVTVGPFFYGLPFSLNILFVLVSLYLVTRASHYLVDGAVHIAHQSNVSPLVIGATVVAMGTSSAELTVNLAIVLAGGDTGAVVGNILGSNLVNVGIELGVSALIAGFIPIRQEVLEKDIPLYFAATGLLTALAIDGLIGRVEAVVMLVMFLIALRLIIQYARAKRGGGVLLVEVTEIEAISHPAALHMSRGQALAAMFGGLVVLVLASRLLVLNTATIAGVLGIPEFVIGLVIIGPGTSLPEIASSMQAARRGHADLVIGTAFGSNLFNLLFGLGLPALILPLAIEDSAILGFTFMNGVNLSLLALLLLDLTWLGRVRTITRAIGGYLVATYLGFIVYQVTLATGGAVADWLKLVAVLAVGAALLAAGLRWRIVARRERAAASRREGRMRILCATRGGKASQATHRQAIALAQRNDADLLFLYVFDSRVLHGVATPIVIDVDAQVEQMEEFLRSTAQERATQAGVCASVIVRTGSLRRQLKAVVREAQVDLVILGNPAGESSLFKLEALQALAEEIEIETGVDVLNLSAQHLRPVPTDL